MAYTVVVATSDPVTKFYAPFTGAAVGEFFRVLVATLVVYDDLSKQAVAYREVSLLLRRPPGREHTQVTYSTYLSSTRRAAKVIDEDSIAKDMNDLHIL